MQGWPSDILGTLILFLPVWLSMALLITAVLKNKSDYVMYCTLFTVSNTLIILMLMTSADPLIGAMFLFSVPVVISIYWIIYIVKYIFLKLPKSKKKVTFKSIHILILVILNVFAGAFVMFPNLFMGLI